MTVNTSFSSREVFTVDANADMNPAGFKVCKFSKYVLITNLCKSVFIVSSLASFPDV